MDISTYTSLLALEAPGWGTALLKGTLTTLEISLGAFLAGIGIGLCCALGKLNGSRSLAPVLNLYTTVVRAIPELILIVALYYAGTDSLNAVLNVLIDWTLRAKSFKNAI